MFRILRWGIVGLVAALLVLITGLTFALSGINEEALRSLIRSTAQLSVVLFLLAFSASSCHALFRNIASSTLLRNRRYIGVSFALSHAVHLLFIVALAVYYPQPFLSEIDASILIGGGIRNMSTCFAPAL